MYRIAKALPFKVIFYLIWQYHSTTSLCRSRCKHGGLPVYFSSLHYFHKVCLVGFSNAALCTYYSQCFLLFCQEQNSSRNVIINWMRVLCVFQVLSVCFPHRGRCVADCGRSAAADVIRGQLNISADYSVVKLYRVYFKEQLESKIYIWATAFAEVARLSAAWTWFMTV